MKQIFALVVAFSITTTAFSQAGQKWSTSGNATTSVDFIGSINYEPLIFKTNNNHQGMFTADGDFQLTSLKGMGFSLIQTDASGIVSKFPMSTANEVLFGDGTWRPLPTPPPSTWELNSTNLYYLNGKVGIGTKTPFTNFDVIGDAYISNNLYVGGGIIITEKINANKEVLTATLRADSIIMDSTKAVYGYSVFKDQVRLENKLQVVGNTQIDGNLRLNGELSFGNNKRLGYLPASGGNPEVISFGGFPLPPSIDPCFSPTVTSNQFQGILQSVGNSVYGGNTNILSMGFDGANGIIDMSGTNTQGGPGLLINYYCGKDIFMNTGANGGNVIMTTSTLGNVGIGTDNPTAKLDVVGGITGSGDFISNGFMQSALGYKFPDGSIQSTAAFSLGSQSNPFQEIYVNNYVKIGTNSLWLNSGAGGNNEIYTTNGALVINPVGVSVGGGPASTGENTYINPTLGNVGIGTTTPSAKLDVNGTISTNEFSIYLRGGGDINHGLAWYGTRWDNSTNYFAAQNIDGPVLFGFSGGALGSTNSGQKIALKWIDNGNVTLSNKLTIEGSDLALGTNDGRSLGNDPSQLALVHGDISIGSFTDDVLHINYNGGFDAVQISGKTYFDDNVGIGTSAPTTKLDVNGQITMRTGAVNGFIPVSDATGKMTWTDPSIINGSSIWEKTGNNIYQNVLTDKVGIGTSTPTSKLHVTNGYLTIDGSSTLWGAAAPAYGAPMWNVSMMTQKNSAWVLKTGVGVPPDGTPFYLMTGMGDNGWYWGGSMEAPGTSGSEHMTYALQLSTTGLLTARSINVTLAFWPDHVFEEDYELPSLSSVEKYIKENNHLPGVPSEKEVVKGGVNLGEMDAILLQKIEELTLYMIDLKKENKELRKLIIK